MIHFTRAPNGIFVPEVKIINLYIDDGGSTEIGLPGYTILALDEYAASSLVEKMSSLISQEDIKDLHARNLIVNDKEELDMESDYCRIYDKIFDLTTDEICRANYGFLMNLLVARKYLEDTYRKFENELKVALDILSNPSFANAYQEFYSHIAFPVYHTFMHLPNFDGSIKFIIFIDRMEEFIKVQDKMTYLAGSRGALFMTVKEALLRFFNTYLEKILEKRCEIIQFTFVSRHDSSMIGVVDGISNFAFNFFKSSLRGSEKPGQTENLKRNSFINYFIESEKVNSPSLESVEHTIVSNFVLDSGNISAITDKSMSVLEINNWS